MNIIEQKNQIVLSKNTCYKESNNNSRIQGITMLPKNKKKKIKNLQDAPTALYNIPYSNRVMRRVYEMFLEDYMLQTMEDEIWMDIDDQS